MIRYIYCILLGVFLLLGVNYISHATDEELRCKTVTWSILQHHPKSIEYGFGTSIRQLNHEDHQTNHRGNIRKANPGILRTPLPIRNITPSKILRIKHSALFSQSTHTSRILLPYRIGDPTYTKTKITQHTYRYYIYALNRILI